MKSISQKAYAKINLAIDLLGKREDNYNEVKMIMQTIDIFDNIFLEKIDNGILIECDAGKIPNDERNIAYKAAKYMFEQYNIREGLKIKIDKNIPVAAGLGGGSADAACVITGINKLFDLKLSDNELMKIGEKIGADVPYCICKNTALATGIGEKLEKLPNIGEINIILIKPKFGVSTAEVYREFEYSMPKKRPDFDILIDAIENRKIDVLANNMVNVLETVTERKNPVIAEIKSKLVKNGAMGSMMSGSGPSIFAIFNDENTAKNAYRKMKDNNTYECYLTKTICFK